MRFAIGEKVKLETFQGQTNAPIGTRDDENYWKLIGCCGEILELGAGFHDGKALVVFDNDPAEKKLPSHNPIPNSLWIKMSDLQRSKTGENT